MDHRLNVDIAFGKVFQFLVGNFLKFNGDILCFKLLQPISSKHHFLIEAFFVHALELSASNLQAVFCCICFHRANDFFNVYLLFLGHPARACVFTRWPYSSFTIRH